MIGRAQRARLRGRRNGGSDPVGDGIGWLYYQPESRPPSLLYTFLLTWPLTANVADDPVISMGKYDVHHLSHACVLPVCFAFPCCLLQPPTNRGEGSFLLLVYACLKIGRDDGYSLCPAREARQLNEISRLMNGK